MISLRRLWRHAGQNCGCCGRHHCDDTVVLDNIHMSSITCLRRHPLVYLDVSWSMLSSPFKHALWHRKWPSTHPHVMFQTLEKTSSITFIGFIDAYKRHITHCSNCPRDWWMPVQNTYSNCICITHDDMITSQLRCHNYIVCDVKNHKICNSTTPSIQNSDVLTPKPISNSTIIACCRYSHMVVRMSDAAHVQQANNECS